jgi:flavin-dependent dehydrogenase
MEEYSITTNISNATHWVAHTDTQSKVKDYITPNKIYEVIKHEDGFVEEDYFIKGDDGTLDMYWLVHNGSFLKVKES